MSKIFVVNAGSSSLKFQLLEMPEEKVVTKGIFERIGMDDAIFTIEVAGEKKKLVTSIKNHEIAVDMLLKSLVDEKIVSTLDEISGVGHRVVHGGEKFVDSTLINADVLKSIEELSTLAPLHNPANVGGIKAFQKALPKVSQVAVFDTSFHQTMEKEIFMYPVPYEWYENYGIRRYGFHGTSHKYVTEKCYELLGKNKGNIITCHIGNGASISAIQDGKSVNTSMGLTPLAGVMMGTRSGDIDPAIVDFVASKEGVTSADITNILNKKSGILGVSGISSDLRDIGDAYANGNERAKLGIELYSQRIADVVGQYYMQLGTVDAIVFTAGVGENDALVRELSVNKMRALNIKLDDELKKSRGGNINIATKDSAVKVFVIETNEELMIAKDTVRLMK